jgi:hypothetical protein
LFSVTEVTTFNKVVGDLPPATSWARKLDWEQVVVDSLEVLTDGVDFVDQVFDAGDAVSAHGLFDDSVVGDLDSLSVNLDGASFVDHVLDGGLGWVSPGDEWITDSQHLDGSFVQSNEASVTDLSESEELKGLLWFWRQLVDTSNSDDQSEFLFTFNKVVTGGLGGFGVVDESFSLGGVFGGVGSGFGDDLSLFDHGLLLGDDLGFLLFGGLFGESGSLFGEALWHSGFGDLGNGHFLENNSVSGFLKS